LNFSPVRDGAKNVPRNSGSFLDGAGVTREISRPAYREIPLTDDWRLLLTRFDEPLEAASINFGGFVDGNGITAILVRQVYPSNARGWMLESTHGKNRAVATRSQSLVG
jgi:hypothetical protein